MTWLRCPPEGAVSVALIGGIREVLLHPQCQSHSRYTLTHTYTHTPELLTLQLYTFPAIHAVRISDTRLIYQTKNTAFGISAHKITGFQDIDLLF